MSRRCWGFSFKSWKRCTNRINKGVVCWPHRMQPYSAGLMLFSFVAGWASIVSFVQPYLFAREISVLQGQILEMNQEYESELAAIKAHISADFQRQLEDLRAAFARDIAVTLSAHRPDAAPTTIVVAEEGKESRVILGNPVEFQNELAEQLKTHRPARLIGGTWSDYRPCRGIPLNCERLELESTDGTPGKVSLQWIRSKRLDAAEVALASMTETEIKAALSRAGGSLCALYFGLAGR